MTPFRRLFEPITIGRRTAKNRIVSSAHATGYDTEGLLTDRYVEYHARKAAGGAGIIVPFGSASVYDRSAASYGSVRLWDPRQPTPSSCGEQGSLLGAVIRADCHGRGSAIPYLSLITLCFQIDGSADHLTWVSGGPR
jgi:hypothetical protein